MTNISRVKDFYRHCYKHAYELNLTAAQYEAVYDNRRDVRFYADRKVTKPSVHHANNVPAKVNKSSNGSTWRNTVNTSRPATTTKPNGHSAIAR